MGLIFTTIHGSRLYGLAKPDSDYDWYSVYTDDHQFQPGQRGQRILSYSDRRDDEISVTLEEFLKRIRSGSHQAIEALFSKEKKWEDARMRPFLASMRVTSPEVFLAYERTIRKFAYGDFKRRRHAVRLALNLASLRAHGFFDPRLSQAEKEALVEPYATLLSGKQLLRALTCPESGNDLTDGTPAA